MGGRNVLRISGTRLVPWAVVALALATTSVLYGSISRVYRKRVDEDFKAARQSLVAETNAIVRRQVSLLHATAGAIEADPGMTQNRFSIFYSNLILGDPTLLPEAVGFSVLRPWEDRGELAQDAKKRGVVNFRFRPVEPRAEAHAVMLIEPLDEGNVDAPGYDMHADATRRLAMDSARRTRSAAMTSRIALAKDRAIGKDVPSVVIYVPVYNPVTGSLMGFVYSGLHTKDLFQGLFPDAEVQSSFRKGIALRLWTGKDESSQLVFDHQAEGDPLPDDPKSRVTESVHLDDVGQTLTAEFVRTSRFGAPPVVRQYVVPVGTLISLMLFLLARSLGLSHEASERRAQEQWLVAETGRLTSGGADDDRVLNDLAQAIAGVLDVVCRFDLPQSDGTLHSVSTRVENRDVLAAIERERPRLQHDERLKAALETGQTQRFDAFASTSEANRERLERLGIGPSVIVPLRVGDRSLGAITITRRKDQAPLSDDQVTLIEVVAGRIALAIDNARLYHDLEQRVEERTRDLEASNHELESFCYSVSHDLRTPLRSLDGFGRALKEDYGERLDEQAHDYIDRIRASTKRMDELITALLTLSRLTRREIVPSEVDATAMAKETMMDLDPDGKVAFRVDEGLTVQADSRMLHVVLENLLGNALKFSSRTENPRIEVGRAADGALFVRDYGAGFDPAYSTKLFQPFERLHSVREFPGHGIGLATVERILRRHGGTVHAEGRPGEGATFYVKFPE